MASYKKLGIFWGENNICFIESQNGNVLQSFKVSCTEPPPKDTDKFLEIKNIGTTEETPLETGGQIAEEEISPDQALINNIRKAVKEHRLSSPNAHLSVSTKEIIFRSFIIPWMPIHEIKQVVEFEASKYLPFPLKELSYSFHPVNIETKNVRRIRVIFVAIKKTTLDHYKNILEKASLNIDVLEPAPASILRLLNLSQDFKYKNFGLTELSKTHGKIIILSQGFPHFVRDFQLNAMMMEQEELNEELLITRAANEIQMSLDYFGRNEDIEEIKQLVLVAPDVNDSFIKNLSERMEMKIEKFDGALLLKNQTPDMEFLKAFGASLFEDNDPYINLDLSGKRTQYLTLTPSTFFRALNYKLVTVVLTSCLALVAAGFLFSGALSRETGKKLSTLRNELGAYQSFTPQMLQEKTQATRNKLETLKKIRFKSNISYFLQAVPSLMPEGVWLENFIINYTEIGKKEGAPEEEMTLSLKGYAYTQNEEDQFKLTNTFLSQLKNDKKFSSYFKSIELTNISSGGIEEYPVTTFNIKCR